jgi:P27 family predicted phage terminase small subunit
VALLHGNPGHRARADLIGRDKPGTAPPPTKKPTCPRFLNKIARREWRRLVKLLADRGTPVTGMDRASLSMLCSSWADYVECEQILADLGSSNWIDSGGHPHPALRASHRKMQLVLMLSKAFGLTPLSRGSVSPSGPPPPPRRRRPASAGQRPSAGWSQFGAS